ncbi:MAG TPA: LysR family transcriptional regulator [Streptosporangiaceae bacterium]|jgi:DNA-binding transcriptional LysR family regulator
MDLRQLEYVTAIADTCSFTRGAERCRVAQSALSRQVAQLESELGARLFHRNNREVRLTVAGSVFVPAARRVLAEAARARAEVDDITGVRRGHIRIGTTQTASRRLGLAALLGSFRRQFPEVTIAMRTGPRQELLSALAAAELDLVLASDGEPTGDEVDVRELPPAEPLVAVVSRDHLATWREQVSLAELARAAPFVEFRGGTELRRRLDIAFDSAGLTRAVAFELGQLTEMVNFAAAGLGTAIVPESFTTELGASVRASVHVLRLADPGLTLTVCAYTCPASCPPAARALADLIVAAREGDPVARS